MLGQKLRVLRAAADLTLVSIRGDDRIGRDSLSELEEDR